MKNLAIFLVIFLCLSYSLAAQSFYDTKKIQKIEIKFAFDNWKTRMDTAKAGKDTYTIALWCKVNDIQYNNVGVKFKGNSSYSATNKKNPLHIALNEVEDQAYKGFTDIKLSNGMSDASMVREALSYRILQDYTDVPQANYAQVYINGVQYGLFTNVESINKSFLNDRFASSKGAFFKCNPISGAGIGGGGIPGGNPFGNGGFCPLKYNGNDATKYPNYELKSNAGFNELIYLCDTINNKPAALANIMDIDRTLWMLAFNNVFVNLDSYSGGFAQNYYLYRDNTRRFLPIIWDLNMSFGGFPLTGESAGGFPIPGVTTDNSKMSAFLHEQNAERPLIKQLLANPTYKKMYVAHAKTFLEEWLTNGKYLAEGAALTAVIDTAFKSDPNKLFTYDNFKKAFTEDATGTGGGIGGLINNSIAIKKLMDARTAYFTTVPAFQKTAPTISSPEAKNAVIEQAVNVTAKITNTTTATLYYRFKNLDKFTTTPMYDDGKHNDGAANDGVFGASFTIQKPETQYYIYAENTDAGTFSPRRAEHEFHVINAASIIKIAKGEVVINEFLANNKANAASPAGNYSDWVELYNNTSKDIDLTNAALSDNYDTPQKWLFPTNTTIKAKGFLIIWADEATNEAGLHAAFKLSNNGERLLLSDANSTVLDSITFGDQKADVSFARCPNGTGSFKTSNPTMNANNGNCITTANDLETIQNVTIYPNPMTDVLHISSNANIEKIAMYDITGRLLIKETYKNTTKTLITLENLQNGIYILQINGQYFQKVMKQ